MEDKIDNRVVINVGNCLARVGALLFQPTKARNPKENNKEMKRIWWKNRRKAAPQTRGCRAMCKSRPTFTCIETLLPYKSYLQFPRSVSTFFFLAWL